ncbi:hypothetical protein ACEWY4_020149 [Coilia grayii]|uniref:Plectin/eS10 N-terminal domain-containing protein n=1 Tax=Coilia grayii TaxID=363190 RepID=A0ABD1JD02_9TELE
MVAGMVMPLADLRAIYELLFREGVMVAKKDKRPQTKHPDIPGVKNLQVIRAMGSLKSRGYVRETFAWRHFYWYLTNEGIVYLRDYLHLPPEIVPTPLQRVRRPAATLALANRAARVQSVEGPTSYVPKPGTRPGAESQEALLERQGYRHKRMGGVAEEVMPFERTPRFRGRPMAVEKEKPKASWDTGDQAQPPLRIGRAFQSEPERVMEQNCVKKITMETASQRPVMDDVSTKSISVFTVQEKIVSGNHTSKTQAVKSTTAFSDLPSSNQAQITAAAVVTAAAVGAGVSSALKAPKEVQKKEVPILVPQETAKLTQTAKSKPEKAAAPMETAAMVEKQKKITAPKTKDQPPKSVETLIETKTITGSVAEIKEVVVKVEPCGTSLQNASLPDKEIMMSSVSAVCLQEGQRTTVAKPEENSPKESTEAVVSVTASTAINTDAAPSKNENNKSSKKKTKVKLTQEPLLEPERAESSTVKNVLESAAELAKPQAEVVVQQKAKVKKGSAGPDMQKPNGTSSLEVTVTSAVSQQAEATPEVKVTEDASLPSAAKQAGPPTVCIEKTVVEQKSCVVELKQGTAKAKGSPVQLTPPPTKPADISPEAEAVSAGTDGQPKVSKSKKKKKTTPTVLDTALTPPPVVEPEPTKVTVTTIKDDHSKSPVPTITNACPQIPSAGMCAEEVCQAAAEHTEAPADKGEVEPALLGAEKIKREVLKEKTSSSQREAPAAAPASAAADSAPKTSPHDEQGEPPSVAQHTADLAASATAAPAATAEPERGERTEEKLPHTQAFEQCEDLQPTPSVITASDPLAAQTQPEDVSHEAKKCEDETDTDAAMRKKIVVVEEVIEVQQIASPTSPGTPPAPAPVPETDELDYDVLEQLAMERALLAGGAMDNQRTLSPDEWDHSLEEPEEKTWPNFQEGLWKFQFYFLSSCPAPVMSLKPLLGPFLGVFTQGGVSR